MSILLGYLRRKSLFATLFVSILLLAALSVISSSMGWYLVENIRVSQQRFLVKTLPLISSAQMMGDRSAALAFITPQITNTKNKSDLNNLYYELHYYLDDMADIQIRMNDFSADQMNNDEIYRIILDITNDFELLRQKMLEKFIMIEAITAGVETGVLKTETFDNHVVEKMTELSDVVFHLVEQIRQLGIGEESDRLDALVNLNYDSEVLLGLNQKAIRIQILLYQLPKVSTYAELQNVKQNIQFEIRSMAGELVGLSDRIDKTLMSKALSGLYQQLNLKQNIGYLQEQLISQNLALLDLSTQLKNDVFELNNLINGVTEYAEKISVDDASEINFVTALGAKVLLIATSLSLIISVVVIWFFVIRKVIVPLRGLANNIRQLSHNELDIEIKPYGMIELNEISQALEVFRDNALTLDEHKNSLMESNVSLTRINDDLNTFIHAASHDIKTPLRGIQVLSDFIVNDIQAGKFDEVESNVRLLQKRTFRLEQLLASLLVYTKLGSTSNIVQKVNMENLVHKVFEAIDNSENFTLVLAHALPVCDVVEADLVDIFTNLFSNSIKHHDRKKGVITVYFKETENSYLFDVCDDGPGIELEFQGRVFNVLQQLKSKDEVEGVGVGLAAVKRRLKIRGGEIKLISDPTIERGCRLIFDYPKPGIKQ